MAGDRVDREAAFHDAAFSAPTRRAAGKYYLAARAARQFYLESILRDGQDRVILEYGCGTGSAAFDLARACGGGEIIGIDISQVGIRQARERAAALGLGEGIRFQRMDAEALGFPDAHFDLVCGSGILHHLDLERAAAEIVRVLKPGGGAVFFEPLGHNPIINLYRRFTPAMRSADEHPLAMADLARLAGHFESAATRFFGLLTLAAVPLRARAGSTRILSLLEAADRRLLRFPWLQRQAWIVVIRLRRPARTPSRLDSAGGGSAPGCARCGSGRPS